MDYHICESVADEVRQQGVQLAQLVAAQHWVQQVVLQQ